MSTGRTQDWLQSHKSQVFEAEASPKLSDEAKIVSITSGKGGVGKTSIAIKLAKILASEGKKILLIDCDFNLSNTAVKLGLPLNDYFNDLIHLRRDFDDCLYKDGNFHLLAACNGNLDLYDNEFEVDKFIIDIVNSHKEDYDYIFLDSPAGLAKATLNLNAYSDSRIVVITPDKSSITDSYSLIKILNMRYGISENQLIVNKVSSPQQYKRLVHSMSETVENYVGARLKILGGIIKSSTEVDLFDREMIKNSASKIHKNFLKVARRFAEESIGTPIDLGNLGVPLDNEQEVQSIIR